MKITNSEKTYPEQAGLDTSRLLSEAEACVVAGVTIDTLKSYTQFSLLKPVIRNQKPFYRFSELTNLFNIDNKTETNDSVPTLEKLLSDESETLINNEEILNHEVEASKVSEKNISESNNLPAVRVEDILLQNQNLNNQIKSLEDERDWLRRRVEILEERSAREQMLMLKEKETLSEIINATLVKDSTRDNRQKFSFRNYIKRIALPFFGNPE